MSDPIAIPQLIRLLVECDEVDRNLRAMHAENARVRSNVVDDLSKLFLGEAIEPDGDGERETQRAIWRDQKKRARERRARGEKSTRKRADPEGPHSKVGKERRRQEIAATIAKMPAEFGVDEIPNVRGGKGLWAARAVRMGLLKVGQKGSYINIARRLAA